VRPADFRPGPRSTSRSVQGPKSGVLSCVDCGLQPVSEFRSSAKKNGILYFDSCCNSCRKIRHIARNQNITPQKYRAMLAAANGRCAVCETQTNRLHLDHCHATGRLRGLLCPSCNLAMSVVDKGVDLQRLLDYQRKWAAVALTEAEVTEGVERERRMKAMREPKPRRIRTTPAPRQTGPVLRGGGICQIHKCAFSRNSPCPSCKYAASRAPVKRQTGTEVRL
jgi:hypothetical protein